MWTFLSSDKSTFSSQILEIIVDAAYILLKIGCHNCIFGLLCSMNSGKAFTRPTSSLETKIPGMLFICSLWFSKVPCMYLASLLSNDQIFIWIFKSLRPAWPCQNYNSVSRCLFCSSLSLHQITVAESMFHGLLCFGLNPQLPQYLKE